MAIPADTVDPVESPVSPREINMPPKWERVAEAIRQQIRDQRDLSEKDDGRYLPSYPKLIEQHKVSYSTMRMAITVLKTEGWIEGEQGIGLRVREDHPNGP